MSNPSNHRSQLNPYVCLLLNVRRFADEFLSIAMQVRTFNPLRQQTRKFSTELKASRILLANVLQKILHKVLLITKVKIFRHRSTINFSEDYFRQQYLR